MLYVVKRNSLSLKIYMLTILITYSGLSKQLKKYKNKKGKKANLVIAANPKVNSEKVIAVMDLAYQFRISSNLVEGRK